MSVAACVVLVSACATPDRSTPSLEAKLRPASGSQATGWVKFFQFGDNGVRIFGEVTGHTPGRKGFHIHEIGDCSAHDAMSAGGHFNPGKSKHGASPAGGHLGDLGNLVFDASGRATIDMTIQGISTSNGVPNSIVGRALIVHMQEDDLKTDATGNAGGRASCGVIR